MKRMNTRNNGAYFTWATRRYEFPLMSKTTRLPPRKSADPNIRRMSSGLFQFAPETMENQSRSGLSASACFLQKAASVLRLNTRTGAQVPGSHFGINQSIRQGPLSSGEAPEAPAPRGLPRAQNHGQTRPWRVAVLPRGDSVPTTRVLLPEQRPSVRCSKRRRGGGVAR